MHEWNGWKESDPILLGNEETYKKAVKWLDGFGDIVDFGGGTGYAAKFVKRSHYSVMDGSFSRRVPAPVDLSYVRLETDCLLMRHVLEHNFNWTQILDNALKSFRDRKSVV